ncbi:MAG: 3-dehydroquinate synthase [Cyanobacteria bacterium SIG31]|nr:3-dehydroquinate synthase [Cyanobacteria bacterium SIG31]
MRQILNVDIGNYKIHLSDDEFSKLMEDINYQTSEQKRLFVISEKVYKLYQKKLKLNKSEILILSDGEPEKNFKNLQKILSFATKIGLTRNDVMVAIGGGVVGDITGFAASIYMRGIDYIQVPTTLLSMVDSSVGGKTAIDLNGIKNIVGAFYQPKAVFININFLKTLDKKQFMSGIGEVLKYAFIEDNCNYKHSLFFFEYLTLCCEKFLEKDSMTLMRIIEYCLNLKISVVNQDEKEQGLRKILNLGHTLGHAIEAKGNFKKFTHGEAVIQGIFFIFDYAYSKNLITYSYYKLSIDLLTRYGFKPINIRSKYQVDEIIEIMKKDKKATKDKITFIVPSDKKKVKEIKLAINDVIEALC